MIGIVSYGVAIPQYRLKVADVAAVWGKEPQEIERGLGVVEKVVAGLDEDAATLAVEAGYRALERVKLKPKEIGAIFVGSESHPYAVNPTSTTVGEYLGLSQHYFSSDLEFACKAGTTAAIIIAGLLAQKKITYGMAIGTDTAQAKPHDILEYTAAAGAAAFILGSKKEEIIAEVVDYASYSSDTPDFWRRDGIAHPSHGGRFTGEPAYFAHVMGASTALLKKMGMKPADFHYCIFHMPNGKFPQDVSKRLGFTKEQLMPSYLVPQIGNPYSASSLLGLASVLDQAKPQEMIFLASYGSGAGSDAFVIRVLRRKKSQMPTVVEYISRKEYISYAEYLKMTRRI